MITCRLQTPESSLTRSSFYSAVSSHRIQSSSTTGSAPDAAALGSFVADLGIGESEEDEFAWIAEFGLRSELPVGWSSRIDTGSGATYFVNNDSLESTWEHPLTPHLKRVVEIGRCYIEQREPVFFQEQKALLWQEHKAELDVWHGPVEDEEGNRYFVNSRDGISSWQDPRAARAYLFDLQCSALDHLETLMLSGEDSLRRDISFQDGGTPWETACGAQVLTLDSSPQVLQGNPSRGLPRRPGTALLSHQSRPGTALLSLHSRFENNFDCSLTLKRMSNAAEWLNDTRQNEEEIQRMKLLKKVEERRKRRMSRRKSKSITSIPTINAEDDLVPDDLITYKLPRRKLEDDLITYTLPGQILDSDKKSQLNPVIERISKRKVSAWGKL